METLFRGIFDSQTTAVISVPEFLLCVGTALVLGAAIALCCGRGSRSFAVTLGVLPAVVCVVIMMVNGNVGAGVAVAGAFSLVRFRSVPGTGQEISTIFLAMGTGLVCGMGYLAFAALYTAVLCAVLALYIRLGHRDGEKLVNITAPEDLADDKNFEAVWQQYTSQHQLVRIKTTQMGSLFRMTYHVTMRQPGQEKAMMDALRCHNGNLEITVACRDTAAEL